MMRGGIEPNWAKYLLIVGAIVVGIATLSYSGFCMGSFRFLSDEEAIDATIDDVLTMGTHVIETPSGGYTTFRPDKPVHYADRGEFLRLNPDCCKMVAHDPVWIDLKHKLLGYAAKSVHVRYMVRFINESGGVAQVEAVAQRDVGNCGHVLNTGR